METIIVIVILILLLGVLGEEVIIKDEKGKETNINEKIKKIIEKIKEKL